jgi:hypothetical protein
MKLVPFCTEAFVVCVLITRCAPSQKLASEAQGSSISQIAMLSVDGGCAAGIVVGFDDKTVYIATAAHITNLSGNARPPVTVRLYGYARRCKTRPQCAARAVLRGGVKAGHRGILVL